MNEFSFEQDDGWHRPPLASKMLGIKLKKGQAVRLETPGGGGYGEPLGRAPEQVAYDVAEGYLTPEVATEKFGAAWKDVSK